MPARRAAALVAVPLLLAACTSRGSSPAAPAPSTPADVRVSALGTPTSVDPTAAALLAAPARPLPPSSTTWMRQVDHLTGGLSPKSVVANGRGAVIANNMMYNHSVTVYDAATREQVATVDDSVDLSRFGIDGHPGTSKGAPVEAAFTSDGRYAYVSNYSMYGAGFGAEGLDSCRPGDGTDNSMLYRLDLMTRAVDQVIEVGAVPKYVAITPDQKRALVSNWCSWTLSVVDLSTKKQTGEVRIAAYPRGIAVSPDSRYAYVTAMGTSHLYRVDLRTLTAEEFSSPGSRVRHVAISPDGAHLYTVSSGRNNGDGSTNVAKIDTRTGEVLARVTPGREPRSLAVAADGRAVYVVNYDEGSVAKVRTDTMEVVQKERTDRHPIGVTYERTTGTVWVCAYGGAIHVFDDSGVTAPTDAPASSGAGASPTSSASEPAASTTSRG